jgi:nitrogen fixation/metabolism regulation signal transduction histidine kinase
MVSRAFAGLDLLTTAVLLLDEDLRVTHANPAAETLLAQGARHLIGARIDRALPGNDASSGASPRPSTPTAASTRTSSRSRSRGCRCTCTAS